MSSLQDITDDFLALFGVIHDKFMRPGEKITRPRLSPGQFHAISILRRKGPLTVSELAGELKISKQQATALVNKLIGSGLAVRRTDEHDRRIVRLEISETGRSMVRKLWLEIRQAFAAKLRVLPEKELEELDQMIRRIREILEGVD